ncbi:MAG: hypothetical protein U9Q07_04315 [Planctomycetota bacterium]|nr:hypothetical protein [Planctomycetota bacterium]
MKETAADKITSIDSHVHGAQGVYPTLADGVSLTTNAADWVLGAIVEIIPASTITDDFDIHEVLIEDINIADKTYELVLYYGAGDVEAGRVRFSAGTTKGGVPNGTMRTPIMPANSRLRGKLAIEDGGSKTAQISVRYQLHPE